MKTIIDWQPFDVGAGTYLDLSLMISHGAIVTLLLKIFMCAMTRTGVVVKSLRLVIFFQNKRLTQ